MNKPPTPGETWRENSSGELVTILAPDADTMEHWIDFAFNAGDLQRTARELDFIKAFTHCPELVFAPAAPLTHGQTPVVGETWRGADGFGGEILRVTGGEVHFQPELGPWQATSLALFMRQLRRVD